MNQPMAVRPYRRLTGGVEIVGHDPDPDRPADAASVRIGRPRLRERLLARHFEPMRVSSVLLDP